MPFLDELLAVELAYRRVALDLVGHDRLRVRRFVLLVVAEPPVPDHVDDDVVAEARAESEREPDGRDRRLRVVGVDVNDRRVEALGEVGRVPGRPSLSRIRGEPDLVVRDQVERPTGRVALERVEIEGLRDDPLAGERSVAVQQDRHRDARVVCPVARAAIGLVGPGHPLDHRVDRLEVARVGRERDLDRAGSRLVGALGAEVVLHVARAALDVGSNDLDRSLSLELPDDLLVRHPDRVGEDVQASAVGHPDHDLTDTGCRPGLERLVEHRDQDVEPFERELLLPEERAAQVPLHLLDLAEPRVQAPLLLEHQRGSEAPGLDRLAEPDALLVIGDVLDLVGDRAAIGLVEVRERLGQRVAGDVDAKDRRRDARLQLVRQLRLQPERIERRVADRLGAQRVEPCRQVAVHTVRLDERHRGRNPAEKLGVDDSGCSRGRRRRLRLRPGGSDGCLAVRPVVRRLLEEARKPGKLANDGAIASLEERAPLRGDGFGILEVLVEEEACVPGVDAVDVFHLDLLLYQRRVPPRSPAFDDAALSRADARPRRRTTRR